MAVPPFCLETGPPSAKLLEIARNEIRETPEVREQAIIDLRNLLHSETDLHYPDDDTFLEIFLRPCHFYPASAIKLMRRIAEFRKSNRTLLHNLMPEDERKSFCDYDVVNVLANRDQDGRRVLLVNCGSIWDPKAVTSDQLFRVFYLIHLAAQLEPETQIRGVVVIMDFEGLTMKQIAGLSPIFCARLLTFIQDAMPLRMKEVHIVKEPFIFNVVWQMFKPFVREKLRKRMHFHGSDMTKLHKFMNPSILPKNYGGERPAIDYTGRDWFPCVKGYEDHIAKWSTYGFSKQI